jgi:hypothetical protein
MFATASNAVVPRFMSWTDEPTSERTDAFSARSWDVSLCPHCGKYHRETGFYFVPSSLEDTVVRRARSDGARGLFLVPNSAKKGYWQCLTREAKARHMEIAKAQDFECTGSKHLTDHSFFYADFSEGADHTVPLCGQALLPRPGLPRLGPEEEAELQRIRFEITRLPAEPPAAPRRFFTPRTHGERKEKSDWRK